MKIEIHWTILREIVQLVMEKRLKSRTLEIPWAISKKIDKVTDAKASGRQWDQTSHIRYADTKKGD